jgi:hypothetical protein
MIHKIKLVILLFTVFVSFGLSQTVNNTAFQSGEILRFKGSYYMSSLWADLAEVKVEVTDYNAEGKSMYSIKATASTYSNYDSFFKIRDLYQTWIDKNDLKPYIFKRNVDEGGYVFNMKYVIKRSSLQARYEYEKKGNVKTSVINITDNTQDLVSILYYIRTFDFEKMALNKTVTISILVDDKVENLTLIYKGKETLRTDVFGSISCYKLGISADNKALVNKETNNIWLTADKNKIPVQAKAEIPVGSIQLRLVEANGIKNK